MSEFDPLAGEEAFWLLHSPTVVLGEGGSYPCATKDEACDVALRLAREHPGHKVYVMAPELVVYEPKVETFIRDFRENPQMG